MTKAGLKPDDASFIGVGAGPSAIAAIQQGEIDAISNIDPVIATLEASGDAVVMAETRTTEGANKVFGGTMSAAVALLSSATSSRRTPTPCRRSSTPSTRRCGGSIRPRPSRSPTPSRRNIWLGDKALVHEGGDQANLQVYSRDGIVSDGSQKRSLDFLRQFDQEIAAAKVDTTKTWTTVS